jgi:hypothetical protein
VLVTSPDAIVTIHIFESLGFEYHHNRHGDWIAEGLHADHWTWRFVSHAEQKASTALVGQGHAIFVELAIVKLSFRFLELQPPVLGRRLPPQVNLFRCCGHRYTTSFPTRSASFTRSSPEMSLGSSASRRAARVWDSQAL